METIILHFVRNDGHRERTRLTRITLEDARTWARRLLDLGAGLYTEVDICTEDGCIETIQHTDAAAHETAHRG